MKKNTLFLILVFFSVSISNFTRIEAKNPIKEVSPISPIDDIIDAGRKQLDEIAIILSTLSGIIADNQVPGITNKKEVLAHIKKLNNLIRTMHQEKFANAQLETAYSLLSFNQAFIRYISSLLKNNFANIKNTALEDLSRTMVIMDDVEPIQVIHTLAMNEFDLKKLAKSADNIGLSWYHHVTRTVDDYVITPCSQYSIPRRAGLAALTVFGTIYGWASLHPSSFVQTIPDSMRRLFIDDQQVANGNLGRVREIGSYPGEPSEDKINTAPIPQADTRIGKWMNNWNPIGRYAFLGIGAGFLYEWKHIKPHLVNFLSYFNNKLKGGSYLREAKRVAQKVDKVRFSDIFGQEEIVRYFKLIVDYLENPEPFDRLGLTPPKGILCIGDTRTGKTFTITALFSEIQEMFKRHGKSDKFKFINLNASEINYFGIKNLLERIQQSAPCIVFIDEIDLLDLQRTGKNETLSEFLTCMSGTLNSKDSKKQVIIIAATNRPETMDKALRQPGRFGKEIRFEYPNSSDRENYIRHKLDKLSLDADQFNIQKLVQATENKSYEALSMLIDNALLKARINGEMLTQKHIETTLDEDIRHIIPDHTKAIPEHELDIIAAHFASQAFLLTNFACPTQLSSVTIKQVMTDIKEEIMGMHLYDKEKKEQQRFEYGKIFTHHDADTIHMRTKDEKLKLIKFHLAGFIGEEILLGSCGYSCHPEDMQAALTMAQSIAFEGLDIKSLPKATQAALHEKALKIIDECKQEVHQILSQEKETIGCIAQELKKQGTLDYKQVYDLVHKEPQPQTE